MSSQRGQERANPMNKNLTFLKLGGSLITDKNSPSTALKGVIDRIAAEVAAAREQVPGMQLLLGHGSGSFGHVPAKEYNTRAGVRTQEQWEGFARVWYEARSLNQIVVESLAAAGLPILAISPSSAVTASNGKVLSWDTSPATNALQAGLIPVVYGDVIFDTEMGGTILSTEELFFHLAGILEPARILIAGIENAVYADFPQNTAGIPEITPKTYPGMLEKIHPSEFTDVTGGMAAKAGSLVNLISLQPGLQAWIFSGTVPRSIYQALAAQPRGGTRIHN